MFKSNWVTVSEKNQTSRWLQFLVRLLRGPSSASIQGIYVSAPVSEVPAREAGHRMRQQGCHPLPRQGVHRERAQAISATENVTTSKGQCHTDLCFLSAQSLPAPLGWACMPQSSFSAWLKGDKKKKKRTNKTKNFVNDRHTLFLKGREHGDGGGKNQGLPCPESREQSSGI